MLCAGEEGNGKNLASEVHDELQGANAVGGAVNGLVKDSVGGENVRKSMKSWIL